MTIYNNLNRTSGVFAYEYGADYIRVQFSTGAMYLYTYQSAGSFNIEQMKILAQRGYGLNSFINRVVKRLYVA